MSDHGENAPAFACDLTALSAEERKLHAATTEEVFAAVQEVRELSDGYALRLPGESATLLKAAAFIANERLCCPFFTFALEVEPEGGPLWLRLTGGDGIKQFIQAELAIK